MTDDTAATLLRNSNFFFLKASPKNNASWWTIGIEDRILVLEKASKTRRWSWWSPWSISCFLSRWLVVYNMEGFLEGAILGTIQHELFYLRENMLEFVLP